MVIGMGWDSEKNEMRCREGWRNLARFFKSEMEWKNYWIFLQGN